MRGLLEKIAFMAMLGVAVHGVAIVGLLTAEPALADSEKGARGGQPQDAPSTAPDSDDLVEPLDLEGWIGGAYRGFEDEIYCEVSDDYGDGTVFYVGWDEVGFYVLIEDPNTFDLEEFSEFDTEITIDDFYRHTVEAFALDADTLDLTFGDDREAVEAFRKGVKLNLEQWDHWYTLYGLGKAIRALESCYKRHNS